MFWGLIMEPQKRYTQKVEKAFHISMAALDISTSSEEPSQVMCSFEGRNYLLCTLRKPDVMQVSLDLNFTVGSELSFAANGKCHVHLTGYLVDDFAELPEMEEVEEEEEDEVEQKVKQKRRKRNTKGVENGPPVKKSKAVSSQNEDAGEDEEEGDEGEDSDNSLDVSALLGKTLEDDDDDNTFIEEEEEDEGGSEEEEEGEESEDEVDEEEADSDDDEAEDVSSLSEVNSEEENQSSPLKVKVNGITNKKQKKKQEPTTPKQNKEGKLQKDKTLKDNKSPKETKGKTPEKSSQSPQKKHLQGGVHIEDLKEGQGPVAKSGKFVTVYYEGRLKQSNKIFDSTNKGNGFSFRLGSGEVIKGWDVGVAGMRVGGKRRIVCPPGMAYGAKGSPPAIPANSTLVFEVELRKIR